MTGAAAIRAVSSPIAMTVDPLRNTPPLAVPATTARDSTAVLTIAPLAERSSVCTAIVFAPGGALMTLVNCPESEPGTVTTSCEPRIAMVEPGMYRTAVPPRVPAARPAPSTTTASTTSSNTKLSVGTGAKTGDVGVRAAESVLVWPAATFTVAPPVPLVATIPSVVVISVVRSFSTVTWNAVPRTDAVPVGVATT